ncbi:MAG: PAS domain-containing protein [Bacteroidota bacterium]|nr:PAS domain-containing protein [Bacteroidota bacterium]
MHANPAFKKLVINNGEQVLGTLIEKFIDNQSIQKLKANVQEYLSDKSEIFNDEVTVKTYDGEELPINLVVSEIKKFSDHKLYIGLFTSLAKTTVAIGTYDYADEVNNLLKRENR